MHGARNAVIQWVGSIGRCGRIVASSPIVEPVQTSAEGYLVVQLPFHLGLQHESWQRVAAQAVAEVLVVDKEGGTVDMQEYPVGVLGVD